MFNSPSSTTKGSRTVSMTTCANKRVSSILLRSVAAVINTYIACRHATMSRRLAISGAREAGTAGAQQFITRDGGGAVQYCSQASGGGAYQMLSVRGFGFHLGLG